MTQYDTIRNNTIHYDTVWYDIEYDVPSYNMIQYDDALWYIMIRYDWLWYSIEFKIESFQLLVSTFMRLDEVSEKLKDFYKSVLVFLLIKYRLFHNRKSQNVFYA